MDRRWIAGPLCLVALTACETGGEAQAVAGGSATAREAAALACSVEAAGAALPEAVRETSGLARGGRDSSIFWTHNDAGNGAELFALDADGQLVQRVSVEGADATDWEDIEAGRCESANCLYIGDIGDNSGERERITVYRVPEPAIGATSVTAVALHARFPDGPRDAESLFRLPSGDIFVVTKGRSEPVTLYRYPAPDRPGETVTLERVRDLFPEARAEEDRVTAATATGDGRWVGIRSYRNLYLYWADALTRSGGAANPQVVDLGRVRHGQGEALVISSAGEVWLSGEADSKDSPPLWARLRCAFPER